MEWSDSPISGHFRPLRACVKGCSFRRRPSLYRYRFCGPDQIIDVLDPKTLSILCRFKVRERAGTSTCCLVQFMRSAGLCNGATGRLAVGTNHHLIIDRALHAFHKCGCRIIESAGDFFRLGRLPGLNGRQKRQQNKTTLSPAASPRQQPDWHALLFARCARDDREQAVHQNLSRRLEIRLDR